MARASSGPTDNVRIFVEFLAASDRGIEFEQTTSRSADFSIRSTAGPESTACVAEAVTEAAPFCKQRLRYSHQRSGGIDQIVHHQAVGVLLHRRSRS